LVFTHAASDVSIRRKMGDGRGIKEVGKTV
jgi:hypothetical protein